MRSSGRRPTAGAEVCYAIIPETTFSCSEEIEVAVRPTTVGKLTIELPQKRSPLAKGRLSWWDRSRSFNWREENQTWIRPPENESSVGLRDSRSQSNGEKTAVDKGEIDAEGACR